MSDEKREVGPASTRATLLGSVVVAALVGALAGLVSEYVKGRGTESLESKRFGYEVIRAILSSKDYVDRRDRVEFGLVIADVLPDSTVAALGKLKTRIDEGKSVPNLPSATVSTEPSAGSDTTSVFGPQPGSPTPSSSIAATTRVVIETRTGDAYAAGLKPYLSRFRDLGFIRDFNPERLGGYGKGGDRFVIRYASDQREQAGQVAAVVNELANPTPKAEAVEVRGLPAGVIYFYMSL